MRYMIENTYVKISIDSKGAELQSIQDCDGVECLWQGDKKYWGGKAPNLFPYIGRLTGGKYYVEGKLYEMTKHGFARDMEFMLERQSKDMLHFSLEENKDTLKMYPYKFKFSVIYTLVESKLNICYKVENKEDKTMYFGVGAHPGFRVPLEEGLTFEDYYLEFAKECTPKRIGVNDAGYLEGEDTLFELENNTTIELQHDLFDHDAIVLKEMDKTIRLKSNKGTKGLEVTYDDMDYLGIWHAVKTDAPYVCIEPWTSLPSKAGVITHIEEQSDLIHIEKFGSYSNHWSITIMD